MIKSNCFPCRVSTTLRKCFNLLIFIFVVCLYFQPGALSAACLLLHARVFLFSVTYLATPVIFSVLVILQTGLTHFCVYIYVSTHTRKIVIRVRESSYPYGTPYLHSDFFGTIRV